MLGFFGNIIEANYLSVTGVTDDIELARSCRDIPIFCEVIHHKDLKNSALPFDERIFQVLTCLRPPGGGPGITIRELSRVVNAEGLIIYGAEKKQWDEENLMNQFLTQTACDLISVQEIDCSGEVGGDIYYLAVLRNVP
jgi:hypothetical protein